MSSQSNDQPTCLCFFLLKPRLCNISEIICLLLLITTLLKGALLKQSDYCQPKAQPGRNPGDLDVNSMHYEWLNTNSGKHNCLLKVKQDTSSHLVIIWPSVGCPSGSLVWRHHGVTTNHFIWYLQQIRSTAHPCLKRFNDPQKVVLNLLFKIRPIPKV